MSARVFPLIVTFMLFLGTGSGPLVGDEIWFPSRVTNGSFEEWGPYKPVGWVRWNLDYCAQEEPFLGEYSVRLMNGQPWDAYLYQDVSYRGGALLFGCAHRSPGWGSDEIIVSYLNAAGQEISHESWWSAGPQWQFILTVIRPPAGTTTMRVKLVPTVDGLGDLIVDHVFMIPIP